MLILDLIINGIVQGSLLSLICIGYSLAYGSAKVINFAHADIMIAGGGYLVLLLVLPSSSFATRIGMSFLMSLSSLILAVKFLDVIEKPGKRILIATAISALVFVAIFSLSGSLSLLTASLFSVPFTAILAFAIYQIGYYPLIKRNAPRTSILLVALGFSITIESVLLIIWGSQRITFPAESLPSFLVVSPQNIGIGLWDNLMNYGKIIIGPDIIVPTLDILIILIFLVVSILLTRFFKISKIADSIIATADSKLAAKSCGIPVYKTLGYAFLLGGAIASIGGTLFLLRTKSIYPTVGFTPGVIAFIACVLGGIGSIRGSIIGAFIVSMVISLAPAIPMEDWALYLIPNNWIEYLPSLNLADWSYGVVYIMMILIILFKPRGLFNK